MPNFGDALNPLLAARVFGNIFSDAAAEHLLFIGTIIEPAAPAGVHEIIVGAGAGYLQGPFSLDNRTVLCVRGPLTCNLLNIDSAYAAIDPASLAARFFAPTVAVAAIPAFMPHHQTHAVAGGVLESLCRDAGIDYICPVDEPLAVMAKISGAACLITEALHGAIVAHSYEVPWVPVVLGPQILGIKWRDFAATIGTVYAPVDICPNIAFDGAVCAANVMKYALARMGMGKARYRYYPIRRSTPAVLGRLQRALVQLTRGPFVVSDPAVQARSIQRLDTAIERFHELRGHAATAGGARRDGRHRVAVSPPRVSATV
ncbi:MAG: polysaccharide pyruvyl transferase family protein [Rhodanobacter sp.]|nr:polysaccharide pyruvyl transferase family protein [Rhodanobacter sp.]